MKIAVVFLSLLSLQAYAVTYTIHWKYFSIHTSYDVKTLIDKEDGYQKITHLLPNHFSFSTLVSGKLNKQENSFFMEHARSVVLTPVEGSSSHQVNVQQGRTSLQMVHLLAHMAEYLNDQSLPPLATTLVTFPFLPVAMFPGSLEYHKKITSVTMGLTGQNLVYATVNVQYPMADNDYNIYLLFQDGNYYVLVSHQALNLDQITQVVALQVSATESGVTIHQQSLIEIGLADIAFQFAVIEGDVFQALTGITPPLPELPTAETLPDENNGCRARTGRVFAAAILVLVSYLACQWFGTR